jgi:hypothetical protein
MTWDLQGSLGPTTTNKKVRAKLDRAVACPRWSNYFPNTEVNHMVSSRYHHCPASADIKKNFGFRKK